MNVREKAYLILENGMTFEGESFGAKQDVLGEVVFTTGMGGYLETLTDLSYHGQIVLQTFPLIGNYGVIPADFESSKCGARGYIAKYPCQEPSNFRSEGALDIFLCEKGVTGLCSIDTRALTKVIREQGAMKGKILMTKPSEKDFEELRAYVPDCSVDPVSRKDIEVLSPESKKLTVAVMDFGIKDNIKRELVNRGCEVHVFPHDTKASDILAIKPDGIMLSNGPGDPQANGGVIETIKELTKSNVPIFGICLGHQMLALAMGFKTSKLKYGHRGANQPVKDLESGRVYITTQNHGYTVEHKTIDESIAKLRFVNVNDGTCEGITYKTVNATSAQFHPEACAGPLDTSFLFEDFVKNMEVYKNATR